MSSSPKGPCLELELVDDRHRKTVVDQIVQGLVHGSLLGEGLAIESRDAAHIRFVRRVPGSLTPSAGEIEVETSGTAKTAIRCRLWCSALRWRVAVRAIFFGALVATAALLIFGWLIVVSVPVAMGVALVTDFWGWRRTRHQLRRRFETFVANSRYLDPL